MARSAVFKNNKGQAVRLPKEAAFPEDVQEVDILKIGSGRLIVPSGRRWDDLFLSGTRLTDDFARAHNPAETDDREPL